MEVMSMWNMEICKACNGTLKLGSVSGVAIMCQACGNTGLFPVERCYMGTTAG